MPHSLGVWRVHLIGIRARGLRPKAGNRPSVGACPEMAMPEVVCQATCLGNFIFFIIHDGKPPPNIVMRKPYSFVSGNSEVQEWKAGCDGMCDVLCEGMRNQAVRATYKDLPQCKIDCFTSFLNGA